MTMLRFTTASILTGALLAFGAARADDELRDRYIAATQEMGKTMLDVMQACAPDVDMSGVDFDYTPRMTEAVGCVIETHIDRFGRPATVELVEQAEAMGERSFSSFREMTEIQQEYPRMSDPAMLEINQVCGTIEASQDLPLSRLMQENMDKMAACFAEPD
ncbi:MAG: hypothetical protein ACNS61_16365 [Candidatus Wenzhouxiangella sp. M2_3B_020]